MAPQLVEVLESGPYFGPPSITVRPDDNRARTRVSDVPVPRQIDGKPQRFRQRFIVVRGCHHLGSVYTRLEVFTNDLEIEQELDAAATRPPSAEPAQTRPPKPLRERREHLVGVTVTVDRKQQGEPNQTRRTNVPR